MGGQASDERKLHNGATVAGYRRKLNLAYCGNRRFVKPKVSSGKRTERRETSVDKGEGWDAGRTTAKKLGGRVEHRANW